MVNRIVVPLDGSPLSHSALPLARGLAEQTGAPVTLLAVIAPPNDMLLVPQDATRSRMTPRDIDRLSGENERQEGYLHQVAATLLKGTSVTRAVRLGNPAEEILEIAEESTDPVIVMGSHGRSGLGRVLLGSVASRVVQGAQCPVFVVRATDDSRAEYGKTEISHVMVPLDGSLLAERALAAVHRVFGESVRLHLVRIIEPVAPGQAYAPQTVSEYERTASESAEEYLRRTAEELTDEGVTVSWEVRGAAPAQGIKASAGDLDVDLIAMTTHGRSGIGRFLLGSVVERVLHDARQPLMVVRSQEARDDDNAEAPPLV